jgi:uncharacterized repeat protein (TIGR02543 family)
LFALAPQAAVAADAGTWSALKSEIASTTSGTITLTADITGTSGEQLSLSPGADVTLDLDGHVLDIDASSSAGAAGIHVTTGMSLTITDTSAARSGQLTARGGLTALSNGGAGIGANSAQPGGDITIEAGTVTATGGYQAAGIGGANFSGGSVTISGGTVNATGGFDGAGIGGGWAGGGGTVLITGGTVAATGAGAAAGIGGGRGGTGAAVTIKGGSVAAVHGAFGQGAPVGGGDSGGTGTLDVYAAPDGPTGTGGTTAAAPAITAHPTNGLRYSVNVNATTFELHFGQVLSFDTTGGSSVPDQFVVEGTTPSEPATAPTEAGKVFTGWYTSAAATAAFDFAAPLTADATAYAAWADAQNTVHFDLGGHGGGIPDQVVDYGDAAVAPEAPAAAGYTFRGWFTDPGLRTRYDFAEPVTAPITLYADWRADPASTTPASTTPASTTPASTTPASTTPASTPASTPVPSDTNTTPPLATTGSDTGGLLSLAALLLLAGGAVIAIARRRGQRG